MGSSSNSVYVSSEAGGLTSSMPPRRRSQRLQGPRREPADPGILPVGDKASLPAQVRETVLAFGTHSLIPSIRRASRLLVRELGFMSPTVAGTHLSPSSVHAIIEISTSNLSSHATATSLSQKLNLEKSSVSRMLKKLGEVGLVDEKQSEDDKREKFLALTAKGREMLKYVDEFAEKQVATALASLPGQSSPESVLKGIESYAEALRASRIGNTTGPDVNENAEMSSGKTEGEVEIVQGYRPGILGRCLEMHMEYYSRTVNFGSSFESQLSTEMGGLLSRLSPENLNDEVWAAILNNNIVGTVWMDGSSTLSKNEIKTARLRAFIVDSTIHGKGVGRKLLRAAMEWAGEKGFEEVELWTIKGLDAARKLYDGAGFLFVKEKMSEEWEREVMVQHFVRRIKGNEDVER